MRTQLFDFVGTLVDCMPTYISAMLRILDENGITYGEDLLKIITPLGVKGTAEYFLRLGVPLSKEQIIEKMKEYAMEGYFYTIQPKAHVIPMLQQPLGIVTAPKNAGSQMHFRYRARSECVTIPTIYRAKLSAGTAR